MTQPVVILHDAPTGHAPEDEDTVTQAGAVKAILEQRGLAAELLPFTLDLTAATASLRKLNPLLVFCFIDCVDGRDDLNYLGPMLLEQLGIPFTGCGGEATFATMRKPLAKRVLKGAGLPTPSWLSAAEAAACKALGGRHIVKSASRSASFGLDGDSVAADADTLRRVLADRQKRYGGEWFAETYIEGREFTVPLLAAEGKPEILAIAEIMFDGREGFVSYAAKWDERSDAYRHTNHRFDLPQSDAPLLARLEAMGLACWDLFGLAGYGRVDVRVDAGGNPWVLEVNANPFISPEPGNTYIAAAGERGIGFAEVARRLAADALVRTGRAVPEALNATTLRKKTA